MKLLVVSDIHGRYDRLDRLMKLHFNADAMIFLGDGIRDVERSQAASYGFMVYSVRGNCDGRAYLEQLPLCEELCLNFEGIRFVALHGHTRAVKSGIEGIVEMAVDCNADVVLFGHTHRECEEYLTASKIDKILGYSTERQAPLRLLNPGSLGASEDGRGHFALVEIRAGELLFSHGRID